jgi:hypothetical protein
MDIVAGSHGECRRQSRQVPASRELAHVWDVCFIALSLVLAPRSVSCAPLDTKYLANELEWNAWHVFLAQNPTCVEALRVERYCICQNLILLQAFDKLGAGHDSRILPEFPRQAFHFDK